MNKNEVLAVYDEKYRFSGHYLDEESNLEYAHARYYAGMKRYNSFLSTDPMWWKYPSLASYNYCGNSPLLYSDPSGMEIIYDQEGTKLGQIGDNTDVRVLNSSMTQKDALAHIESGSDESLYALLHNSTAFADYFTDVNDVTNAAPLEPYTTNCYDAAQKQMQNAGYEVEGSSAKSTIFTNVENGQNSFGQEMNPNNLTENTIGGAIKIMTDLRKGKPVLIGVMQTNNEGGYRPGENRNPRTSHFLVINSSSVDNNRNVTFTMRDNARGRGTLSLNLLNGVISGATTNRGAVTGYTVSEVRNSWKRRK